MIKTCKICNKEFKTPHKKVECCSTECSNKAKSKIYALLKDFKTFGEIPVNILKVVRQWDRNHLLKALKLHLPHLHNDFKKHWDNCKICKCCGNFFKRSNPGKRALEVCDKRECQMFYKDKMVKRNLAQKETCIKNWGVDSYSKTKEFKETVSIKNPFYSKEWQARAHETIIKNAGGYDAWIEKQRINSINFQQSLTQDEKLKIAEKREATTLERHGVANMFYAVDSTSKNETKFLADIEKIGVNIVRQHKIGRFKVDGFISPDNFGNSTIVENFKIPQNSKGLIIEYLGDFWHGNLRYYGANEINPKTSKKHLEAFENTFKRFDTLLEAGYTVAYIWESDYLKFGLSPLRLYADYSKIISNFLNDNNINFVKNNDIFSIPEHSIELYIHRFEAHPKYTKKGIYNITKEASQRGIRVIHIFEQYIREPQKFEIIKNIILHACGKTKHKVYARNLTIEVKKSAELKDFFNKNNIAGHRGAEFGICLMQGDDIIMAYSIGKPFFGKGKYDAEIVRGACKIGYSVIGGASKIWNYLIKNYDYNSIVYYVDLNCYNGQSMGFLEGCEYIGEKPGFWNYWVETQELKNREPSRHAEIMQKTRAGEIITITNAGTQVNVWYRNQ